MKYIHHDFMFVKYILSINIGILYSQILTVAGRMSKNSIGVYVSVCLFVFLCLICLSKTLPVSQGSDLH